MNWADFFYMDGYAFFVWSSYGIAFVVLLINVVLPWHRKKQIQRSLGKAKRRRS